MGMSIGSVNGCKDAEKRYVFDGSTFSTRNNSWFKSISKVPCPAGTDIVTLETIAKEVGVLSVALYSLRTNEVPSLACHPSLTILNVPLIDILTLIDDDPDTSENAEPTEFDCVNESKTKSC